MLKLEKPGLAVDIDETLSGTIGYWVTTMQEKFGNPENLSVKEVIEKYRYTQNVPYWQSAEALAWIDQKIHSNELQEELPLIEDADIYLKKIAKIIPIAAYITVRPEVVLSGTQNWLNKHHLPQAPIICRPPNIAHQDGNAWKADTLSKLYPQVLGIIDDNAKLLEYLPADYQGVVFLYDHHETNSQLKVTPCPHWPQVYSAIKKYLNQ